MKHDLNFLSKNLNHVFEDIFSPQFMSLSPSKKLLSIHENSFQDLYTIFTHIHVIW